MPNPSSKRLKFLLFILAFLLILACQGLSTGTPEPGAPAEPGWQESDQTFGPGEFAFPDPQAGLDGLSSYKATLSVSFEGTRSGDAYQSSTIYTLLYSREPAGRALTIETTATLGEGEPTYLAEMNGVAYQRTAFGACTATALDPANSLIDWQHPSLRLSGVLGAEAAGHEAVNGVEAEHYTFDERALVQDVPNDSTGGLWVSTQNGYLVRYLLTTSGDEDIFGEGFDGTLVLDYELTEVNQPISIPLPNDCPQGMVDAPLLADASDVLKVPGMLRYESATSLEEAAAFYQEQIPGLGWSLSYEPAVTETNTILDFVKGEQALSVIITTREQGTSIVILLTLAVELDPNAPLPDFPEMPPGFPTSPP